MTKKLLTLFISAVLLSACGRNTPDSLYERYESGFTGVFDTHVTFIAYTRTEAEYKRYLDIIHKRMSKLNELYDIYNDYGVNNLKTVNDSAGAAPVAVDREIIDLALKAKAAYEHTGGLVNIALGPVLRLWHDARTASEPYLPQMDLLKQAARNTDISNVIIDEQANTIFLKNKGMSLDVGAVAKGHAVMLAADAAVDAGLVSGILNAGGNVVSVGKPMDGRDRWGVGIQDPHLASDGISNLIDTVFTNDMSVVTSGDYQRFYTVDDKKYNHIIDPNTLMPAEGFAGVSVLHPDSFVADMLSTAMFILPQDESMPLLKEWGAQGLWVFHDGSTDATDGYKAVSKTLGGYSAKD